MMKRIQELVAVKICHDLSGVLGAINNGMELYYEADESFRTQALDLVQSSAKEAVNRVVFFRYALGTLKKQDAIDSDLFSETCENYLASKHVGLEWSASDKAAVLKEAFTKKCFLLTILFLSSILMKAKNIHFSVRKSSTKKETELVFSLSEASYNLSDDVKAVFDAAEIKEEMLTTKLIEAVLLKQHVSEKGTIRVNGAKDNLEIIISF